MCRCIIFVLPVKQNGIIFYALFPQLLISNPFHKNKLKGKRRLWKSYYCNTFSLLHKAQYLSFNLPILKVCFLQMWLRKTTDAGVIVCVYCLLPVMFLRWYSLKLVNINWLTESYMFVRVWTLKKGCQGVCCVLLLESSLPCAWVVDVVV
jgi:hypothetical protein